MKRRNILFAIGLSLLFHTSTMLVLSLIEDISPTKKDITEEVVIEIIDSNQLNPLRDMGQIVEQSETALNDEVPEDSRFLSKHNQKVVRETRAANIGEFQNDGGQGPGSSPQESVNPPEPVASKANESMPSLQALMPGYKFQARKPIEAQPKAAAKPALPGDGLAQSQTTDHLPDLEVGAQTLLSAREFVYYSYYQRIRQQLSQHWEPIIKHKLTNLYQSGRNIASEVNKVTRVMIVLDQSGTLIRVQLMTGSGLRDLDDAAIEAFRAAAPFPNPPQGIVESDGTIKIRWDFILEA